jgi:hypothetical protein
MDCKLYDYVFPHSFKLLSIIYNVIFTFLNTDFVLISYFSVVKLKLQYISLVWGAWGGVVVKALRSDGPGIDSWWCHWIFQ